MAHLSNLSSHTRPVSAHTPSNRLPRSQVRARCSSPTAALQSQAPAAAIELNRRSALIAASAALLWPRTARAEEAAVSTAEAAAPEQLPQTVPEAQPQQQQAEAPKARTYNEKDFVLVVPPGFREVRDAQQQKGFGEGGRPLSTYERVAALTPLRAKFTSEDGKELLNVIQRNASEIKQTLFQITDISEFGSVEEVGRLLLPREVTVLSSDSIVVSQPARDTGTLLGTVEVPEQSIYRYTFKTRGQRAHLAVVAKAGKVYLVGGSTSAKRWPEADARLRTAVESFRLV